MNKLIFSTVALLGLACSAAAAAESAAVAPDGKKDEIPATAVQEVNQAVKATVKTSAKSIVAKDIASFCKDAKITIGAATPTGAIYLKGVECVAANDKSPDFPRSRVMAFSKAYSRAVAAYVMDKVGENACEQFDEYFSDQSTGRLQPATDIKTTADRISEKMDKLAEAKLDEGLRRMGVTPEGSITAKRALARNSLVKSSVKRAMGSSAGLLPVQTFEGWDDAGRYAVGCVIRGGIETEVIAECLRDKRQPHLVRPESGLTVEEALPTDDELVSQFGVRLFFDKNGVPALLSFGQWGSAYAGTDPERAEEAMDHALEQAEAEADDQLTMFINSTVSIENRSERGEVKETNALFRDNQLPTEEAVSGYLDVIQKAARSTGSDTMIGRSTVCRKVLTHPNGHKLAVVVRMWSFGQFAAMKNIIERPQPKPEVKPEENAAPRESGKRRGRNYDF